MSNKDIENIEDCYPLPDIDGVTYEGKAFSQYDLENDIDSISPFLSLEQEDFEHE